MKNTGLSARPWVLPLIISLCSAASVALMLSARGGPWRGWTYTLITIASVGFVLVAVAGGAHRHGYGRLLFIGLVGCCLGDLLGPYDFIIGSTAFLLAHFAFIAAWLLVGIRWNHAALAAAVLVGATVAIGLWLLPHVPREHLWLVLSYILVISVMVALAWGARPRRGRAFIVTGATLFYISDIFVARWKYVVPDGMNALFCFPLYYTACILLALSVTAVGCAYARD